MVLLSLDGGLRLFGLILILKFVFGWIFIDPTPDFSTLRSEAKFIVHDAFPEHAEDLLISFEHTLQDIQIFP